MVCAGGSIQHSVLGGLNSKVCGPALSSSGLPNQSRTGWPLTSTVAFWGPMSRMLTLPVVAASSLGASAAALSLLFFLVGVAGPALPSARTAGAAAGPLAFGAAEDAVGLRWSVPRSLATSLK